MKTRTIFLLISFLLGGFVLFTLKRKFWAGRTIKVTLPDGKSAHIISRSRPYRIDMKADRVISDAVKKATNTHITKGNPVARYDLKRKTAYWEYPDGRIEYTK